jgi:hypothetical protein
MGNLQFIPVVGALSVLMAACDFDPSHPMSPPIAEAEDPDLEQDVF